MDMLTPPVATTFEMVAALVSAALYLLVGIAVLAKAPRDIRARLFFFTALASAPAYLMNVLLWARGSASTFTLPVMAVVGLSLMLGSLTLFHFTQVFPWRRPWIRTYSKWLLFGYFVVPAAVAVLVSVLGPILAAMAAQLAAQDTGTGSVGGVSAEIPEWYGLVILLVGLPVIFVVGAVVPFGALMSLFKTWNEAKAAGAEPARITSFWILISQMAGGVLAILVIPLLRLVAPVGPWVTIAATLLFAFGLLMPIAFAAGVWKYRVLDLDPEVPPG